MMDNKLSELSKPVQGLELAGWQFKSVNGDWLGILDELGKNQAVREGCEVREVYAISYSPNDRDAVREAHAEWSRSTFGNVGPIGPLKHLSKEALEAAAKPDDFSEWADMQLLLWDAQRRAGRSVAIWLHAGSTCTRRASRERGATSSRAGSQAGYAGAVATAGVCNLFWRAPLHIRC